MSFTRFHDDPARIQKANIENTHMNEYVFNVPGNGKGMKSQYFSDPRIRLQHTGVSMQKDLIGLENSLRNMGTPLNKDHINKNDYKTRTPSFNPIRKDVYENVITSESRATHPAFEYREKKQHRSDYLFEDPQKKTHIPFQHNLDTNILEKDYYNLKTYKKI